MSTAVTETLFTAGEFANLPEPPDAGKMELVRGRLVVHMPVGGKHGQRQVRIAAALQRFLETARRRPGNRRDRVRPPGGPRTTFGRLTSPSLQPLLLPGGELPEGFIHGAPLLAVEVVSPNDAERDVLAKVGDYLDAGVQRVWLVRARNQTVVVYHGDGLVRQLSIGDTLTSADAGFATDGFQLPLSDIFA